MSQIFTPATLPQCFGACWKTETDTPTETDRKIASSHRVRPRRVRLSGPTELVSHEIFMEKSRDGLPAPVRCCIYEEIDAYAGIEPTGVDQVDLAAGYHCRRVVGIIQLAAIHSIGVVPIQCQHSYSAEPSHCIAAVREGSPH